MSTEREKKFELEKHLKNEINAFLLTTVSLRVRWLIDKIQWLKLPGEFARKKKEHAL